MVPETTPSPGANQITRTRFVSKGAPAGGDGTQSLPFRTLAEGIAALAALPVVALETYTLAIFPGDYSAEPQIDWSANGPLLQIAAALPVGLAITASGVGSSPGLIFIPGIEMTSPSGVLSIVGCLFSDAVSNSGGAIVLTDSVAFGADISCPTFPLYTMRSVLIQNAIGIGGEFSIVDGYLHLASFDISQQGGTPALGTITGSKIRKDGGGGPFNFTGADPGTVFVDGEGKYWAATNSITITNGAYENMV